MSYFIAGSVSMLFGMFVGFVLGASSILAAKKRFEHDS